MCKRYAIVENGRVVNIAVSEAPLAANWIESESACIGDIYTGGRFVKPSEDEL